MAKTMTATEAKNRFGQLLEMAQAEPVHVQKGGRDVGVMISPEQYRQLLEFAAKPKVNPMVEKLHAESVLRWGKVYEALAK
ncbi:MAG: type II toxin-antitoxin system Phd/YefM family antitoxin [Devosia sp.]|nr:type II toxin-antitoxin system Phd/YefM family antitoxin [Devosia sp.]